MTALKKARQKCDPAWLARFDAERRRIKSEANRIEAIGLPLLTWSRNCKLRCRVTDPEYGVHEGLIYSVFIEPFDLAFRAVVTVLVPNMPPGQCNPRVPAEYLIPLDAPLVELTEAELQIGAGI